MVLFFNESEDAICFVGIVSGVEQLVKIASRRVVGKSIFILFCFQHIRRNTDDGFHYKDRDCLEMLKGLKIKD